MFKDYKKYFISLIFTILAAFIQTYSIQSFIIPSKLITGGFTGVSILLNTIFHKFNIDISIGFLLIALNLPVAIMCIRGISKKFVFYSLVNIFMTSVFLRIFKFEPIFTNLVLNISIGAVVYGLQIVLALKAGGSTGGMDFIALYISNKKSKTIWEYVFLFNMLQIIIFAFNSSWDNAGYSIIFQFITTRIINTFYNRYHRMTIQIMTEKPDELAKGYIEKHYHGMTITEGRGAYLNKPIGICYTIVSVYDVNDIIDTVLKIDPKAIINIYKTQEFHGNFYIPPM